MTLDMLGAVMSKTDLHFLHPWDFATFCEIYDYKLRMQDCDASWGRGPKMHDDLRHRIPLALKDGNLPFYQDKLDAMLYWLGHTDWSSVGATMVYRIDV
jgi:hypothetical protein